MNTLTIKTIKEIIKRLDKEPNRIITSNLGSGCHARSFGVKLDKSYKIVIPGDTFSMAKTQLEYLLRDLAIDVGLDNEPVNLDS
jgi:hypothetical protein